MKSFLDSFQTCWWAHLSKPAEGSQVLGKSSKTQVMEKKMETII